MQPDVQPVHVLPVPVQVQCIIASSSDLNIMEAILMRYIIISYIDWRGDANDYPREPRLIANIHE